MTAGALLDLALDAANHLAGPWSPGAPNSLASAYELASARDQSPKRFVDASGPNWQEHRTWRRKNAGGAIARSGTSPTPAFNDFRSVYGGEFTLSGFWTVARTLHPKSTTTSLAHGICTEGRLAGGVYPCDQRSACGRLTNRRTGCARSRHIRRWRTRSTLAGSCRAETSNCRTPVRSWRYQARTPFVLSSLTTSSPTGGRWLMITREYISAGQGFSRARAT